MAARDRALVAALAALGLANTEPAQRSVAESSDAAHSGAASSTLPRTERWALLCAASLGVPQCTGVQTRVCSWLRDDARVAEGDALATRDLVHAGAVDALCAVLRHHGAESPKVAALAASALGNVAASCWAPAKDALASAGAIQLLLALLAAHGGAHAEAAVQGCRAIGNACFGLDAGGAVECKRRVMAPLQHRFGRDGRRHDDTVAGDVTADTSSGGSGAGALPDAPVETGLHVLLAVLREHSSRPDVVRWAAHALGNVVYGRAPNGQQDAALAAGAVPALLAATAPHVVAHPKTAAFACEALGNLVFRNPPAQAAATAAGALGFALATLRAHGATTQRAAESGLFCLAALLGGSAARDGDALADADAAQFVVAAVAAWGGTSPAVRRWAKAARAALAPPAPEGMAGGTR